MPVRLAQWERMCYNGEKEVMCVDREELLVRRLQAQHLLLPGEDPARDLCGLQAQYLRNAVHALRIRTGKVCVDGLVKTWTLRGTVHLVPEADLPLYIHHCGTAEDVCRSGWYQWTAERGHANPPAREIELACRMVEAIAQGIDTRDGLRAYLRAGGMTEAEEGRVFNPWGGLIAELASIGVLAFRVDMADAIHPAEDKRYRLLPPFVPLMPEDARLELVRRYFTSYGPATLRDAAYFFRWTQKEIRDLLTSLPVTHAVYQGQTCYWMPGKAPDGPVPEVILGAGFDPLMMGYRKEENPLLPPEHLRGIFNLIGIVHPPVILRGRVVAKWKERKGHVEITAFEAISAKDRQRIALAAERAFPVRKMSWQ